MPDTSAPRATLPFPSATDAPAEAAPEDPLAGDWAEGLRGPVREVPLKRPTRLRGQSGPTPRPLAARPPEQRTEQADLRLLGVMSGALRTALPSPPPVEEEVEAPEAWASTDDQLASMPPPPREQAEAAQPAAEVPLAAALAPVAAPESAQPPEAGPQKAAAGEGHDTAETPHPLTAVQADGAPATALAEPPAEEVMLLSDAELAEDEPLAAPPVAALEESLEAAPPVEAAPLDTAAPPAPATEPVAAPGEHALQGHGDEAGASASEGPPPASAQPEPPALEAAAPAVERSEANVQGAAAVEPLAVASQSVPGDFASEHTALADAALAVANPTTGESVPLPGPGTDAQEAPAKGAVAEAGLPLAEDLENTVLSLAVGSMQRPAAPPEAAAGAVPEAAPAEEGVEELPEDAIAEPLPEDAIEDAIADAADAAAPWKHAEVEVTPLGAAAAQTPWDTAGAPEWHADAASGEWAGSAAQPSTPGAAAAAPAGTWGTPATPAAYSGGWGDAPAAHGSWGAPAAPASQHAAPWGAPAPAEAAVVSSWALEPAGAFSADKLVSSPGAGDWVIEAAPRPAADAWEAKPAASWDVPVAAGAAAASDGWETKTASAFPVREATSASSFAPRARGASLSAEDPAFTDHGLEPSPDDADLPVPVYGPEPVLPPSHLAVAGEHRVAVHTRAGRTRRGVVKDVDLAGTGFSLQPQSGTGVPESVQAAEVKAIFFMLPPGEKHAPGSGTKVRVTFEDGRTIEGQRDGGDAPEGFFLVPGDAARTNTRRIFVARAAVQDLREG